MRKLVYIFLGFIFVVAACVPLGWPTPTQTAPVEPPVQLTHTPTLAPAETPETPTTPAVISMKIWVPPHMDPAADTPAGKLLQSRLAQFARQHNDLTIDVRVKAISGAGGLLDSLAATSAAAPLALPDVIALPREGLEAAVLKGLLQTVEDPEDPVDDSDWYEFALQLVRVQNSPFGLPICGDALVTVYRPAIVADPPLDWTAVLELKTPFVFPAADQQAMSTLAFYQSLGVNLRDEEGRPSLEADHFSQVLTFYDTAEQRGIMPFWLTQYQNDQEVWDAYTEKRADVIIAWLSDYLTVLPEDSEFSTLPVESEEAFTLADGWVWAMASMQDGKRALALELVQFLSEGNFLKAYANSLGCIAPYRGMIDARLDSAQLLVIEQVALSARVIPATDILNSLGLPVQQAVMQVIKNQAEPLPAAQTAVDALTSP